MTVTCRVCGTDHDDGAVRCDGTLPDGTRCGADLVEQDSSTTSRAATGGY